MISFNEDLVKTAKKKAVEMLRSGSSFEPILSPDDRELLCVTTDPKRVNPIGDFTEGKTKFYLGPRA